MAASYIAWRVSPGGAMYWRFMGQLVEITTTVPYAMDITPPDRCFNIPLKAMMNSNAIRVTLDDTRRFSFVSGPSVKKDRVPFPIPPSCKALLIKRKEGIVLPLTKEQMKYWMTRSMPPDHGLLLRA